MRQGYYRKGTAHAGAKECRLAFAAFTSALKLDPRNKDVKQQLKKIGKEAERQDKSAPVTSPEHWRAIFAHISDIRSRLSVMALFWNDSSLEDRHALFSRFLEVITGAGGGVSGCDYALQSMVPLPMDNYVDIVFPQHWLPFYTALDSERKIAVFQAMYLAVSDAEKTMIVHDLRHFMDPAQQAREKAEAEAAAEAEKKAAEAVGGVAAAGAEAEAE